MPDILKKITDTEAEFGDLWARHDKDKDLYNLKKFELTDKDGRAMPNVENLTLNDPRTFADKVISTLVGADMQTVVEGEKLSDTQTTYVEGFLKAIYSLIDERLANQGKPPLYHLMCSQSAMRGHIGTRFLMWQDGDKFIADALPFDTRYLVYELGTEGLLWESYYTMRKKAKIWDEYKIEISGSEAPVRDYWDNELNYVFIHNEEVKFGGTKNKHGYPPVVIQQCPGGFFTRDQDFMALEGEGIFAANRNIYPEMNKLASVLHTLNMMSFRAGVQLHTKDPKNTKLPDKAPFGTDFAQAVDIGGGWTGMPVADVKNATRLLYTMLEGRLQKGSLSTVNWGTVGFPLPGVSIAALTEEAEQVYFPRLQAIALLYQSLSKMIIKQYIAGSFQLEVGGKTYSADQLKGDYEITFKFFSQSPQQNIANYSVAAAADAFVSRDTIRRDILQLQDPDGEEDKRLAEMAARISPLVLKSRVIKALIRQDKGFDAELMAEEMGLSLEKLMAGEAAEVMEEAVEEPAPQPGLPLLGKGGARTPQQQSSEMAVTEEAE